MDNPLLANVVDLLSIGLIAVIAWYLGKWRWFVRIPLAVLIGWPIIIASVALHWRILAASAATPIEAEWVANHDSGPLAVSLVLGWLYAFVVVLATEAIRAIVHLAKRLRASQQSA